MVLNYRCIAHIFWVLVSILAALSIVYWEASRGIQEINTINEVWRYHAPSGYAVCSKSRILGDSIYASKTFYNNAAAIGVRSNYPEFEVFPNKNELPLVDPGAIVNQVLTEYTRVGYARVVVNTYGWPFRCAYSVVTVEGAGVLGVNGILLEYTQEYGYAKIWPQHWLATQLALNVFFVFAALSAVIYGARRLGKRTLSLWARVRESKGKCGKCGYPLQVSRARCPECGYEPEVD